jgi:hypothetical protein
MRSVRIQVVMVQFIDDYRVDYGVEPICWVMPIGPSTYYEQKAREADPSRLPRDWFAMPSCASKSSGCGRKISESMEPARSGVN